MYFFNHSYKNKTKQPHRLEIEGLQGAGAH